MKCCNNDCRQGRDCPNRTSILDNPRFIMICAIVASPFILLWMLIRHPVICYRVWKNKNIV
jgi:hypothetical protein